jgi:hypothetical protein
MCLHAFHSVSVKGHKQCICPLLAAFWENSSCAAALVPMLSGPTLTELCLPYFTYTITIVISVVLCTVGYSLFYGICFTM